MNRIKRISFITSIFFALTLTVSLVSCSKDDDGGNELADIPSGELVAVELRNETLTGFPDDGRQPGVQKWWTHVITSIEFSSTECGDDITETAIGYLAFYPTGGIFLKNSPGEEPFNIGSWEWANSNRSAIFVSNSAGQGEFTVTWLNENNVVYGSVQSSGGCSATTYEQFDNPYFE